MDDSQRIGLILNHLNLTAAALAKELGYKRPQLIYDIKKGKSGISKKLAQTITEKYCNIDKLWLLTGEGSMLKSGDKKQVINSNHSPNSINNNVMEANIQGDLSSIQNDVAKILDLQQSSQRIQEQWLKRLEESQNQINVLLEILKSK